MHYTRRDLGKLTLAAFPAATLLAKPNSRFGGVQISIIAPYSLRGISGVDEVLKALVRLGLSAVQIQSSTVEGFAGAPMPGRGGVPGGGPPAGGQRPGGGAGAPGGAPGAGGPGGAGQGPPPGGGRGQMTPEMQAAMQQRAEELRKWRLSAPMGKFKEFVQKFAAEGVEVEGAEFRMAPAMTDDEIEYCFQVAKAMGLKYMTSEPPLSMTKRIAAFSDKHRILLGFHNHSNVTNPESFCTNQSFETAMSHSKYHGMSLDVGHYSAGNSASPIPLIRQYPDRIANLHLKDRKFNQGPNVPWGQGDTPLKEILQLMKREKYTFSGTIEMEHPIPPDSDVMTELAKCVQFCKDALA